MANSIAKLAILMTADTSGMAVGMARGEKLVRGFNNQIRAGSIGGFDRMNLGAVALSRSLEKGKLDAKGLALAFGGPLGMAASIAAATTLVDRFARSVFETGEQMKRQSLEARRGWEEAAMAVGEYEGKLTDTTRTLGQAAERFRHEAEAAAFSRAEGTANALEKVLSKAASGLALSTERTGGKSFRENQARIEALNKEAEAFRELKRQQEEAAREAERNMQRMMSRAASITQQLRTPAEMFVDSFRELESLHAQGMVTIETFKRGTAQALQNLIRARGLTDSRIGAAEFGTAAGYSASVSGQFQMQRLGEIREILKDVREILRKETPPVKLVGTHF